MTAAPVEPVAPNKSPWIRWVVLGCAGVVILGVLGAAALILVLFAGAKRADVYVEAVARARAHPGVRAAIGEPIETGFWVSGTVSVTGPSGEASLAIPLKGPKGKGTLYVEATKEAGTWQYETLEFEPAGAESRIDLLGEIVRTETPPRAVLASAKPAARKPALTKIVFAMDHGPADVPDVRERFPSGVKVVMAGIRFENVRRADEVDHRWHINGTKVNEQVTTIGEIWGGDDELPAEGWFSLRFHEERGLPSGDYRVDIWFNGKKALTGTFVVE